jgi:hypothetical protein
MDEVGILTTVEEASGLEQRVIARGLQISEDEQVYAQHQPSPL